MRVIVIGAGLLGTGTAYFLAEKGHEVVVLDRAGGVARETSYANGGVIHAGNAAPWNAPGLTRQLLSWAWGRDKALVLRPSALPGLAGWGWRFLRNSRREPFRRALRANARLAVYSLETLRRLRERVSLHYHESRRGSVVVFRDEAKLSEAVNEAVLMAEVGVRHEVLDREALALREPALAGGFAGGLWYPDDESGDARLFTENLAELARGHGAEFRLETTVERLLGGREAVAGVATDRGVLRGDAYVLAAGSYSSRLSRPLGLKLPIYPVKGHSITIPMPASRRAPATPIIDIGRRIVAAPLGGRLRVAGFAEFAGYDDRPDIRRAAALLDDLAALFPDFAGGIDPAQAEPWAGLRPVTADGRPLLGPSPIDNLFLATGTGHLGWTFAAGAGRIVADSVAGNRPEIDPDDFRYGRPGAGA